MATERNKRLVYQILSFLSASLSDGSIRTDDAEGIEIASQCISEAFDVDLAKAEDKAAYALPKGESLASILEKHVQNSAKSTPAAVETPAAVAASAEDKAKAEKAKLLGNQKMAAKDYDGAIAAYGDAIALDGRNSVYWSNRAAAHSSLQAHDDSIADARKALEIDPSFSKAWSRLGHALFQSGEYSQAVDAYEEGLKLDPTNKTMQSSLATVRSRLPSPNDISDDEDDAAITTAPRGAAAGFPGMPAGFPGMAGMGGPGGLDFASLMSNPAVMQMAQQMMSGGGMEQMMQNPMIQQMMAGAGGAGGGMPDLGAMMNDPMLRNMMNQMGGGGAGRPRAQGDTDDGNDGPADMYS